MSRDYSYRPTDIPCDKPRCKGEIMRHSRGRGCEETGVYYECSDCEKRYTYESLPNRPEVAAHEAKKSRSCNVGLPLQLLALSLRHKYRR